MCRSSLFDVLPDCASTAALAQKDCAKAPAIAQAPSMNGTLNGKRILLIIGGLITATILTLFVLPAIAKLVLGDSDDKRSWRQKWRERLRRNATEEEQGELGEVT